MSEGYFDGGMMKSTTLKVVCLDWFSKMHAQEQGGKRKRYTQIATNSVDSHTHSQIQGGTHQI